ncbi:hypothetical protein BURPS1710b_2745 [Burkholderia pseudomallei 1710b]|uniref:Uncharacterized protein n=1 Tax=Burkholderia pseudomallei (strain 1710b) TaxID=320372 RepID=Q3JQM2_BURP1|nr:hypothetical protein BURPS1710b_2745 [Burkholderia pseudomallei 1710b]
MQGAAAPPASASFVENVDSGSGRAARAARALNRHRVGLGRVEVVLRDGVGDDLALDRAFIGERVERRDRDPVAVHLEEVAQRAARVRAAEAVGAEHDVAAVDLAADLVGERADVVGRRDHRALRVLQARLHVRQAARLGRMQQVPALDVMAFARELGEARHAPEIGGDAPVVLQQVRRGDHFVEDRARAEQLHARRLLVGVGLPERVHALDDVGRHVLALRNRRVLVVLVHHRHVVIDVLLLLHHPAQAVLHDDGELVAERRIVAHAVRHRSRPHQRVAVFVLQAFAVERRAARGAAEQETARAHVARRPREIADALEAEHRIEDIERHHDLAVRRVRRRRRDPVAHAARFVDAFLQDLAGFRFLVEHQLIGIFRHILLAFLVPDADLAEQALHAERARFVRHDRHDALAERLVLQQDVQDPHERHRRRDLAAFARALEQRLERVERRHRQRLRLLAALRQIAAERLAVRAHVLEFLRAFVELQVRHVGDHVVGDRQAELVAELLQLLDGQLLLLVRDVHRLAGFAHPVALDRLRKDHRRRALRIARLVERRVDLVRIVAAAVQVPDVVVGPVGDERLQLRRVEEVLAHVRARLRLVRLILAVDGFHHPAHQRARLVAREQRIPAAAPDHLDHVPAGAAELRFELLDDLAVAAHRAVETLQVAVDHEHEVIELLAARHADRAERFRLVGLAVAEERPDLAAFRLHDPARLQVLHEARLIDRHDGTEAHRHGRELPEIRHQPRVRIRRDAVAAHFLAEVVELIFRQAAEQERARVNAGRRMALHEHEIAAVLGGRRVPEVVVADVIERRGRSERRDVAADVRVLARAQHHRDRVPARVRADPVLDVLVARNLRLGFDGNRVDVRGVRGERQVLAVHAREFDLLFDQVVRAAGADRRNHAVERFEPFDGFLRVVVAFGCDVLHHFIRYSGHSRLLGVLELKMAFARRRMPPAATSSRGL